MKLHLAEESSEKSIHRDLTNPPKVIGFPLPRVRTVSW